MLLSISVNNYMDCLLNQTYLVSDMHGLNGQGALDQILVAVYGANGLGFTYVCCAVVIACRFRNFTHFLQYLKCSEF